MKKFNTTYLILFIISSIFISTQIVFIQIFAYEQFYHFASMIISYALLGLGLSGIVLSIFQKLIIAHTNKAIFLLIIISSFFLSITFYINRKFFVFDSYLIFYDLSQLLRFVLVGIFYSIQFTLFASIIGIFFIKYSAQSSRVYFVNLIGSAFGGVIVILLMWLFDIQLLLHFNSMILVSCAVLYLIQYKSKAAWFLITLVFLLNLYFFVKPIELKPSQYKGISRTLNLPDAKITYKQNSPHGKIEIIKSKLLLYAPGLSLNYTGEIPSGNVIFNNGEPVGFQLESNNYEFLKHSTLFLPYLFERSKILILNSNGGIELYRALLSKFDSVVCIEQNPIVARIIERKIFGNLPNYTDLISVKKLDPRIFIETTSDKYDVIFHPPIEAHGVSSGLYALQEKYLFTVEAFRNCLKLIREDGVFSISVYIDYPYRNVLKLFSILNETIRDKANYDLIAINNWNLATLLIKNGRFSPDEIFRIKSFCELNQFDVLFSNYANLMSKEKFNSIQDTSIYSYIDSIISNANFIEKYPFNITAAIDDKPFFSNFIRIDKIFEIKKLYPVELLSYVEVGYFLIWIAFALILMTALLLLVLIFYVVKLKSKLLWFSLIYFSSIGLGFMIFEILMIQKMVLLLSNNIYAVTFVICSILLSAGLGSLFSSRIKPEKKSISRILISVFTLIFLANILSPALFKLLFQLSDVMKYLIGFIFVGIVGFFMGMPFPLGIKFFANFDEKLIPFSWGINGSFSVIASVLAIILSLNFGFKYTLFGAAIFYLINSIVIYLMPSKNYF